MTLSRFAGFTLAGLLAACGALPQPFAGNPGVAGARLSQPPPSRLVVPPPTQAMLSDIGADTLAGALVTALVEHEIPAVEDAPRRGDWSLSLTAEMHDGKVVPSYEVADPTGKPMGAALGQPIDLKTWSDGAPETMRDAAAKAAPSIVTLLQTINAARQRSDPNSLLNRPARIAIKGVTGAPGDGDTALARQMKLELTKIGEVVQDSTDGADYLVRAEVVLAPGAKGMQRVEIQWIVADAKDQESGRIVQLNEIAPGSLDKFWGDVAFVVAKEAAGGVKEVILNQVGGRP
jgi:hypothetical protein